MPTYSIIVAIADNHAIGKNNQLLWHLSDDLKYFKQVTSGKTVIMGYNTWLSLPFKPLPHRKNIVLIDSEEKKEERFTPAMSLQEVHELCADSDECFVMGGGFVYRQFLPIAHRLYITRVLQRFDADTFFPDIDPNCWQLASQSETHHDTNSGLDFRFEVYERR